MKRPTDWRLFLLAALVLLGAVFVGSVWNAFAAFSDQGTTVTATMPQEATPAVTPTMLQETTPVVTSTPPAFRSADTTGITAFAFLLLVVILGGIVLGGWLTTAPGARKPPAQAGSAVERHPPADDQK